MVLTHLAGPFVFVMKIIAYNYFLVKKQLLVYNTNMDKKQLLTTKEAANLMGWTSRYVVMMINQGRLQAQKIGRDWVIQREDLDNIAPASKPVGRPRKDSE